MIKMIITGHGKFSEGLYDSLSMIAGKQAHVTHINFVDGMPLEDFNAQLEQALTLDDTYNGAIIYTDLKGGTPFNVSMLLSEDREDIEVVYGTNLPLLIESVMSTLTADSPSDVLATVLNNVFDHIGRGVLDAPEQTMPSDDEGI